MTPATWRGKLRCLAQVLLVFLLLGPPIGALTFILSVGAIGQVTTGDLSGLAWIGLFALIYGVPISYLIGGVPAGIAGLILGVGRAWLGWAGWRYALAVGALVGVGVFVATGQPIFPNSGAQGPAIHSNLLLAATCFVATLICWRIVASLFDGPSSQP